MPKISREPIARTLSLGSIGEDVRTLQIVLNSDAETRVATEGTGSPGSETTRYGAPTKLAVQKFQQKYGIAGKGHPAFGVVGPATRSKLNSLLQAR